MSDAARPSSPEKSAPAPYRGRRGGPIKFLGALRGDGTLISPAGETAVTYQLDVYQGAAGRTGSGAVDGAMPEAGETDEARLRLADGRELAVTLQEADENGASIEIRGEPPAP